VSEPGKVIVLVIKLRQDIYAHINILTKLGNNRIKKYCGKMAQKYYYYYYCITSI